MPRIITDQPASGKPLQLFVPSTINSGFVNTSWYSLVEAPDFSIPTSGDDGSVVDPNDSSRELRPGEVFLETPLGVTNNTLTTQTVELQVQLSSGQEVPLCAPIAVPFGETIYVPIQGQRLLKTDFDAISGDRLRIRSSSANSLTVFGSAAELGAQDHAPDTE